MKTLYIDCGMGAAGDMLTAALLELLNPRQRTDFVRRFNELGIPGIELIPEPSEKCGILGTHVSILIDGLEEDPTMYDHMHGQMHGDGDGHTHGDENGHTLGDSNDHGHAHTHESSHEHRGIAGIEHIVRDHLDLPDDVRQDILAVYTLIAEAESKVHGAPVDEIHFHEVGSMDAIADVTAVCLLMHQIHPDQVIVSPVNTGSGTVRCAHGVIPVPAPATAYLLQGIPSYSNHIRSELCTPTGAALLKYFATDFGNMPIMQTEKIGYGMGKKDFETANCVRVMLGQTQDGPDHHTPGAPETYGAGTFDADQTAATVLEFACNIDDMTGEEIGFAMDQLLKAGALDVWTEAIGMKKNRPGVKLCVLAREEDKNKFFELIFRYTTTLGIRVSEKERAYLTRQYDEIETPDGTVRKKTSTGYGARRVKYEYEDLARIAEARGITLREARYAAAHTKTDK